MIEIFESAGGGVVGTRRKDGLSAFERPHLRGDMPLKKPKHVSRFESGPPARRRDGAYQSNGLMARKPWPPSRKLAPGEAHRGKEPEPKG